ncbi:hypothetical protein SCB49_03374 [unidentified eubacterium SCB49]|nr:hypothetical protein SCB49_03374 [unidentified eubacterium SCB49]
MEIYVLKSFACLSILFLFYKLVLENSTLHTTKRIYLLASIILSIVIPFITFTQYVAVAPVTEMVTENVVIPVYETQEIIAEPIKYTPYILWSIYTLGVLFFTLRFTKNLISLVQKIRKNPVFKKQSFLYVLLQLPVTPHSFFKYIFIDKEAFEAGKIPKEVLIHEQAHVAQKHSWDILFFEIFQIIFWFNPLLYFFKRSIKLNHEFLADRTVLQTGAPLATYQSILLDFSSKSSVPVMAHSINYSSIKKRFTIMKRHTSKKAALLKGFLVLPLLAVLIYGFSSTKEEFITSEIDKETITVTIDKEKTIWINSFPTNIENIKSTLKKVGINPNEKYYIAEIIADESFKMGFISDVQNELFFYGIRQVKLPGGLIGSNPIAPELNKNLTARSISIKIIDKDFLLVENIKTTKKNLYATLGSLNADITKEQRDRIINIHVSADDDISYKDLLYIQKVAIVYGYHRIVTPKEEIIRSKGNVPMAPESPIVAHNNYANEYVLGATEMDLKSFLLQIEASKIKLNGVAVKLENFANAVDKYTKDWSKTDYKEALPSILIKNSPKEFLDKVDEEFKKTNFSKANAGMGIIPPPPPTSKKVKVGEESVIPPPPVPPTSKKVKVGEESVIPPPPPPPNPPIVSTSKLDHIIRMAKENAAFSYNNKPISSDKAIALLKENSDLNISTEHFENSNPIVTISKEGIKN